MARVSVYIAKASMAVAATTQKTARYVVEDALIVGAYVDCNGRIY